MESILLDKIRTLIPKACEDNNHIFSEPVHRIVYNRTLLKWANAEQILYVYDDHVAICVLAHPLYRRSFLRKNWYLNGKKADNYDAEDNLSLPYNTILRFTHEIPLADPKLFEKIKESVKANRKVKKECLKIVCMKAGWFRKRHAVTNKGKYKCS